MLAPVAFRPISVYTHTLPEEADFIVPRQDPILLAHGSFDALFAVVTRCQTAWNAER
jgi:hypothetical protein